MQSFFVFPKIKSFGVITIFQICCRQRRSLFFGTSINPLIHILTENWLGLHLIKLQNALIILSLAAQGQMKMGVFTQRKNQSPYIAGYISTTPNPATKSSTPTSAAAQAELRHMTQILTSGATKSTRHILTYKKNALQGTQHRQVFLLMGVIFDLCQTLKQASPASSTLKQPCAWTSPLT